MRYSFALSVLALIFSYTLISDPVCAETIQQVEHSVQVGPSYVMKSWMQPTVVRTRDVTDKDGVTRQVTEPIIQERHEQVVVPQIESSASTTVINPPNVMRRDERIEQKNLIMMRRDPSLDIERPAF